jgi:hypothetical protein
MNGIVAWLWQPVAFLGFNWVACIVIAAVVVLIVALARWSATAPAQVTERQIGTPIEYEED